MRSVIIYSSVTGNTRRVAEGIAQSLPVEVEIYPVQKAPVVHAYDLIILGFWVYRAKPDPRMLRYMKKLQNHNVALFGTLAAWPDSSHAQAVLAYAHQMLLGNRILGEFLCLGKLSQKRFAECMNPIYKSSSHPMTAERKARLIEGQKHPNATDINNAANYFRSVVFGL